MKYIKTLVFSIFILLVFFLRASASIIDLPEQFKITNNPFLDKITSFKDLEYKVLLSKQNRIIPVEQTLFKINGQEVIKTKDELYLLISQTGVIYRMEDKQDSVYTFKRIDATININYNIDCNNFIWNKNIYSYGGYGFWKLNGHLRAFNFLDKEWDITPTNIEIISNGTNWFDKKEGKLYVPYQVIVNAGIKSAEGIKATKINDSYYLDLATKNWIKLGSLNLNTKKLVVDNITSSVFSLDSGYIYMIQDEAYYFNFINNKIYKSKNPDLNQFFVRRVLIQDIFLSKDSIYSYSPEQRSYATRKLSFDNFEALDFPIWGLDDNYFYLLAFIVLVLAVLGFTIWIFNRKLNRKLEQSKLKIFKSKLINQAFVGTEVALISLLLKSSKKGLNVEIAEINHVLGIKDKNVGLQKKVRSDIMNAINEKYKFITQSDNALINSIRKEDDKRFYEYFIPASEHKTIENILEKN